MNQKIKDAVKKHEMALLDPKVRESKQLLKNLIADDFVEIGSSGKKYGKQHMVKYLPTSPKLKFVVTDFKTKILAADTVLVTYQIQKIDLKTKEKKRSLRASIWQHRKNGWQIIFHQGTPS